METPLEGEGRNRAGWREEPGWRQSQGRTQWTLNGWAETGMPFRVGSNLGKEAGPVYSTTTCHWTSWDWSVNLSKVALLSQFPKLPKGTLSAPSVEGGVGMGG